MIRNQLETSRINAVRFFKHRPCQTPVSLFRAYTSWLYRKKKDMEARKKPGHDVEMGSADALFKCRTDVCGARLARQSRNHRRARRDLLCLSRRTRTIRDRNYTLARRPAGALCADPALYVSREAAGLRPHERNGKAALRR